MEETRQQLNPFLKLRGHIALLMSEQRLNEIQAHAGMFDDEVYKAKK